MTPEDGGGPLLLTDLERDALTEIINIGVSRAAKNLGRMVKDQVNLSVPRMEIMTRDQAVEWLSARENSGLVAVGQDFRGSFSGQALLIFPEAKSLELVRTILDGPLSLEEIVDLEQEALAEVGNVVLNGCLVVMANMLKQALDMSLPRVMRGSSQVVLLGAKENDPAELVLFLTIDFAVRARNINGYIALFMDFPSLSAVKALVRDYIDGLEGGK
ncbi:chemotaxis protein X [Skermanella stibiiresistens SB22]|uniref:Chemotaxis protein X n=1 Tax=Skermanella stibiiresistens SB22 TaxID=1385369 RepID=W9H4K2_9PROT|nr:chemotaxis protein CheX [Skermanella stibiiresistens]EWY38673.1 chemotaxis protein X [Skermanella stibiiresistens SB22]